MNEENKKPKKYMLGGVILNRWKNSKFPNYTLNKRYQDGQGEWQDTQTLSRDDLLKLKLLINKALEEDIKEF